MSIRLNSSYPTRNTAGLAGRLLRAPVTEPWVRNPSWPACEANSGDNKLVGLYAVWPYGGNFIAMTISGAYTVDYGDGTTTNYTSGSTAYYEFDYNDADLAGTDAPVTLTAATDTVDRTAHGYTDGMTVKLYNIVTTTGVLEDKSYYVINATANSFQISLTPSGSAIDLVGDGSATLLPYKVATVTVTPQAGANLTSINLFVKHNQSGLVSGYSTGWLDIAIASSTITSLSIGSTGTTVRYDILEQVKINQLGSITGFGSLFANMRSLRNVVIKANTSTVTSVSLMFRSCFSLQVAPLFDTSSVTNMSNMFDQCNSLIEVPLFNTSSVTSMSSMFNDCFSIVKLPLFNTSSVTNMSSMFSACQSLREVPLFNTSSVTNMSAMFSSCYSIISVPLLDTSSVTNMNSMFNSCFSLTEVPLLDTSSVTSMSGMFNSCRSLTDVPLFDTSSATNMSYMFSTCFSLKTVPIFDTSSATDVSGMFNSCSSLFYVPPLNVSSVTSSGRFSSIFSSCNSLTSIKASDFKYTFSVANCKLSSAALDEIYTNLPTVVGQTITVTGNYGTTGDDPTIATAKGWTVTG